MIASMAISLVAGAVLLWTLQTSRSSSRHLVQAQWAYALAGAQASALVTLQAAPNHRVFWDMTTPLGDLHVLAEPEASKLSPLSKDEVLTDSDLTVLGATNPQMTRSLLIGAGSGAGAVDTLLDAAPSDAWRSCVRSFLSPWGQEQKLQDVSSPLAANADQASAPGGTWRVLVFGGGWLDDTTVTLTGDPRQAVVRDHRPPKRAEGLPRCEKQFGA